MMPIIQASHPLGRRLSKNILFHRGDKSCAALLSQGAAVGRGAGAYRDEALRELPDVG
jgi:hypothetical protein